MGFIVKLVIVLVVAAMALAAWTLFAPKAPAPQVQNTSDTASQEKLVPKDISVSGSTDAALEGDLSQLDAQIGAAKEASLSAESFTDLPIEQSE